MMLHALVMYRLVSKQAVAKPCHSASPGLLHDTTPVCSVLAACVFPPNRGIALQRHDEEVTA